ncbi:hypothetical protein [Streptomyces sp. NPDC001070]
MQLAPSALHATAETLGSQLGWTPNELIIDDVISLDGPLDRQIAMRLLDNGGTVQMWATGGTQPADHQPTEGLAPLPQGHRWHTWVHIGGLEADADPAAVLHDAITDRLLPVFDTKPLYVGHRPWDPAPELEVPVPAEDETTAPVDDDQPAVEPTPHLEVPVPAEDETTAPVDGDQPAVEPEPAPEPAPAPEPKPEPAAKVVPIRGRRTKPAAEPADTPAADAEPKPRTARKRTTAKPAAAKTAAEAKPRPARKRTTAAAKPATS